MRFYLLVLLITYIVTFVPIKSMAAGHEEEIIKLKERVRELEKAVQSQQTLIKKLIDALPEKGKEEIAPEELAKEAEKFLKEEEVPTPSPIPAQAPPILQRLNEFNPRITVFGDFLGRLDDTVEDGMEIGDRFSLREVELDFRADIDPFSKGVVIGTWEDEGNGETEVDIEEGYLTLDTLPFGIKAKAGRFRPEFGKMNLLHTHDLPQATRPLPILNFLGEEGWSEEGISLSRFIPNPLTKEPLHFTFQLLNGENEKSFAGKDSDDLAYLARLKYFQDIGENQSFEIGFSNVFGLADEKGDEQSILSGMDFLYKWRPLRRGEYKSLVFQAELFSLNKEQSLGNINSLGTYAFAQYQFRKNWYLGTRGDWSNLAEDDNKREWSLGLWLSYYTTEFLRIRVGFEHLERNFAGNDDRFFLEFTPVFGSHPPEPYWVNR